MFRRLGITFAVYGEGGDTERLIPFDTVPRVLTNPEWQRLSEGLIQRVRALNAISPPVTTPAKTGIAPNAVSTSTVNKGGAVAMAASRLDCGSTEAPSGFVGWFHVSPGEACSLSVSYQTPSAVGRLYRTDTEEP